MKYYSIKGAPGLVDFREAALMGQAPDKGLYFPESIPRLDKDLIKNIEVYTNEDIAFDVIRPYVGNVISEDRLRNIVKETIQFPIPLVEVAPGIFSLELFWGPTMAFKDVGARFMSRCIAEFIRQGAVKDERVVVLVATSGDTGGAVANAIYKATGKRIYKQPFIEQEPLKEAE